MYFDPDKNPCQIKTELLTKWLAAAISEEHPEIQATAKRAQGRVVLQWSPLARISVQSETCYRIEWNKTKVESKNIIVLRLQGKAGLSDAEVSWG